MSEYFLPTALIIFTGALLQGLAGFGGALLSMPITMMLLLVCQRDESTRWLAQMIGREA